jgi:hypothetical protein
MSDSAALALVLPTTTRTIHTNVIRPFRAIAAIGTLWNIIKPHTLPAMITFHQHTPV